MAYWSQGERRGIRAARLHDAASRRRRARAWENSTWERANLALHFRTCEWGKQLENCLSS